MPRESGPSATQRLVQRYVDLPLEEVACFLCGSREGRVLVDDPPFKVLECARCGLGYTTPRIDATRIHEIYGDTYFNSDSAESYGYSGYVQDLEGYIKTFQRKARIIRRHIQGGRLLEIGCAAGVFLKVMQDAGFEVHGTEIAQETLAHARERFGLVNLHQGPLQALSLPGKSFDVVAMFDVIEHVPDPVEILTEIRRLLIGKGLLVIQTQDLTSLARRVLGPKWHHFKQLEHIYHFSPQTLPELLDRAGFDLIECRRSGAGKYVSLQFLRERLHRRWRLPAWVVSPLKPFDRRFVYVNPRDELLAFARARE